MRDETCPYCNRDITGDYRHRCPNYPTLNTVPFENDAKEIARLRRIEDAAVKAVDSEEWSGDAFHERMGLLMDALRGE